MTEQTGPGSALAEAPKALVGRQKIIRSDNEEVGEVMVQRWSIEKWKLLVGDLVEIYTGLPPRAKAALWKLGEKEEEPKEGEAGSLAQESEEDSPMAILVLALAETGIDRVISICRWSVRPEDRDKVMQMDADELIDLVQAVLETNPRLIPKLKKKGAEILARFAPGTKASNGSTP